MRISYDPDVDALYIRLVDGEYECRTVNLTDEISLNIGPDELLVGIEVLDATEVVGQGSIPAVVLENLPVVPRQDMGESQLPARELYSKRYAQLHSKMSDAYYRTKHWGVTRPQCSFKDFAAGYVAASMEG